MVRGILAASCLLAFAGAARADAILIPYDGFPNPAEARKVKKVVDSYTFYRRIEQKRFNGTASAFNFLLDRMPMTAAMMREMGLEKYVISIREDGVMMCDDKEGVVGTLEPMYCAPNKRIFYGDGTFSTGVVGRIRGESVVVLEYAQEQPNVVCNTITVYIRVHSFFSPLMRLASPIVRSMVSRKTTALLNASMKLSEQLVTDPEGVYREICDCRDITPEQLGEFRRIFIECRSEVQPQPSP